MPLFDNEVDVEMLVEKLDFVPENLDQSVREQASLFMKASYYRVQTMRKRIQLETAHDQIRAEVSLRLREKKREAEKGKALTEGAINVRVDTFATVVEARLKLDRAYVREEHAKLLVEAYRQRRDSLRLHVDLAQTEMAGELRMTGRQAGRLELRELSQEVSNKYRKRE